eukprot:5024087-Pyramimonas_sp.AAC.1
MSIQGRLHDLPKLSWPPMQKCLGFCQLGSGRRPLAPAEAPAAETPWASTDENAAAARAVPEVHEPLLQAPSPTRSVCWPCR